MGCNASACGRASRPGMAKGPHAAAYQAACDNDVEAVNSALEDGMPIDTTDRVRASARCGALPHCCAHCGAHCAARQATCVYGRGRLEHAALARGSA
jgi:hypothetical protein